MSSYASLQPYFQQLWNATTEARVDGSVLLLAELQGLGKSAGAASKRKGREDSDASSEVTSEVEFKDDGASSDASDPTSEGSAEEAVDMQARPSNGFADGVQPGLKPNDLEAGSSDIATTVMRRLMRGLASPREQARLGFAVALTELLQRTPLLNVSAVLDMLLDATTPSSSADGPERRDYEFGCLFGLLALLRSGIYLKASSELSNAAQLFGKCLHRAVELGAKAYLRESAGWLVLETMKTFGALVQAHKLDWRDAGRESIISALYSPTYEWTPEMVAWTIYLQSSGLLGKLDWSDLLGSVPDGPDVDLILHESNVGFLQRTLKSKFSDTTGPINPFLNPPPPPKPTLKKKKGNKAKYQKPPEQMDELEWRTITGPPPRQAAHYVWSETIDAYTSAGGGKKRKGSRTPKLSFEAFVKAVIVETLLAETASPTQRNGLAAYEICLERVEPKAVLSLIHEPAISFIVKHSTKGGKHVWDIAERLFEQLLPTLPSHDPSITLDFIYTFYGKSTIYSYLYLVKHKLAERLAHFLPVDQVPIFAAHLSDMLLDRTDDTEHSIDDKVSNLIRRWAIDTLGALLVKQGVKCVEAGTVDPSLLTWVPQTFELLATHGYFEVQKASSKSSIGALRTAPRPAISDPLGRVCRDRLENALTALWTGDIVYRSHFAQSWPKLVLRALQKGSKDSRHCRPRMEHETERAREARAKVAVLLAETESLPQTKKMQTIRQLVQVALIVTYDHPELAMRWELDPDGDDMIEQLTDMLDLIVRPVKESNGSHTLIVDDIDQDLDETGVPAHPSAVLINYIVSLAHRRQPYIRLVSESVFEACCADLDDQALTIIMDALVPKQLLPLPVEDKIVNLDDVVHLERTAEENFDPNAEDASDDDDAGSETLKMYEGDEAESNEENSGDESSVAEDDEVDGDEAVIAPLGFVTDLAGDVDAVKQAAGVKAMTGNFLLDLGIVRPEIRAQVLKALQDAGIAEDDEEVTALAAKSKGQPSQPDKSAITNGHYDDDSWAEDNEGNFDDEQMFQLDSLLTRAFKAEYGKGVRRERARISHHRDQVAKQRYLDLLGIYMRIKSTSPDAIVVMRTLYETVGYTRPKMEYDLNGHACKVLKGVLKHAMANRPKDGVDPILLRHALDTVHCYARLTTGRTHLHYVVSDTSLYFSQIAIDIGRADLVAEIYAASIDDLVITRRCHLKEDVLDDIVKHHPAIAFKLLKTVLRNIAGTTTRFHRTRQLTRLVDFMYHTAFKTDEIDDALILESLKLTLEAYTAHLIRACTEPVMHAVRMRDTLKAVTSIVRRCRKHGASDEQCDMGLTAGDLPFLERVLSINRFRGSTPICELANTLDALTRPNVPRPEPFGPGADRTRLDECLKSGYVGLKLSKTKLKKIAAEKMREEMRAQGVEVPEPVKKIRRGYVPGQGGSKGPGPRGVRKQLREQKQFQLDLVEASQRNMTVDEIQAERKEELRYAKAAEEATKKLEKKRKRVEKVFAKSGRLPEKGERYFTIERDESGNRSVQLKPHAFDDLTRPAKRKKWSGGGRND